MKGNAKCKNFRFKQPFVELTGNVHGSSIARSKARCRLPISYNYFFFVGFHDCGTIKRNVSKSAFSDVGGSHFERKFYVDGDVARNPSMVR